MKFIKSILKKIISEDKKILGRWNLEYCDKKLHYKVGLSNEDNCGACSQYALTKNESKNKNISAEKDKNL